MTSYAQWRASGAVAPKRLTWLCGDSLPLVERVRAWAIAAGGDSLEVVDDAERCDWPAYETAFLERKRGDKSAVLFVSNDAKAPAHVVEFAKHRGSVIVCSAPMSPAAFDAVVSLIKDEFPRATWLQAEYILERAGRDVKRALDACALIDASQASFGSRSLIDSLLPPDSPRSLARAIFERKPVTDFSRQSPKLVVSELDRALTAVESAHEAQTAGTSALIAASGVLSWFSGGAVAAIQAYPHRRVTASRELLSTISAALETGERALVLETLAMAW